MCKAGHRWRSVVSIIKRQTSISPMFTLTRSDLTDRFLQLTRCASVTGYRQAITLETWIRFRNMIDPTETRIDETNRFLDGFFTLDD